MGAEDGSGVAKEEHQPAAIENDQSKNEEPALEDKPAAEAELTSDVPMQDAGKEPGSGDQNTSTVAAQPGPAEAGSEQAVKAEAEANTAATGPAEPQRRHSLRPRKQESKPAAEQHPAASDEGDKEEKDEDKEGHQQTGGKKGKGAAGKLGGGKRAREETAATDTEAPAGAAGTNKDGEGVGEGGAAEKARGGKAGRGPRAGGRGGSGGRGGGRGSKDGKRSTPEPEAKSAKEVSPAPAAQGRGTRASRKAAQQHTEAANGSVPTKEKGDEDVDVEEPAGADKEQGREDKTAAAQRSGKLDGKRKDADAAVKEEERATTPGPKRAAAEEEEEEEGRSSKKQKVTSPVGAKQGKGASMQQQQQGETTGEGKGRARLRRGDAAATTAAGADAGQEAAATTAEYSILDALKAYADPASQQSKDLEGLPLASRLKTLQQALLLLGKFGAGLEALIATFYKDQYGGLKESCEDLINGGQQTVAKLFQSHSKKKELWTPGANVKATDLVAAWKSMSKQGQDEAMTAADFIKTNKQSRNPAGAVDKKQEQAGALKPGPAQTAGAQAGKSAAAGSAEDEQQQRQQARPQKPEQPAGLQQRQQAGQQGGEQASKARAQSHAQRQGHPHKRDASQPVGAGGVGDGSTAAALAEPGLKAADGMPVPSGTVLVLGYPSTGDVVRDKAITLITCCLQSAQEMAGPLEIAQQVEAELHARYASEDGGPAGQRYKLALHALWTLLDEQGAAGGVLDNGGNELIKPQMNGPQSEAHDHNLADSMRQLLLKGVLTPQALLELLHEMTAGGS